MIPTETSDFASLSGGIASLNHRLNADDALRATAPPYGLPSSSPLHSELSPPSLAGALPGNVTYLSRRAINPRKGDSSCYPRVMPEAYPWLKRLSPRLNPESGLHSHLISMCLCNPFQGCVVMVRLAFHGCPIRGYPRLTLSCPFRAKSLS